MAQTAIATASVPSVRIRIPIPHEHGKSYTAFSITCSRLHPFFRTHWVDPANAVEHLLNEEPRSGDFLRGFPTDICGGNWQSSKAWLSFMVNVVDLDPPNRTISVLAGSVSLRLVDGSDLGLRDASRDELGRLARQLFLYGWEADSTAFDEFKPNGKK